MKDLGDDTYRQKLDDDIEAYFLVETPKIKVADEEIPIPKDFVLQVEKAAKFYEVDDMLDLRENYELLTKEIPLPRGIEEWFKEKAVPVFERNIDRIAEIIMKRAEINHLLSADSSALDSNIALNICTMDNVYLSNFDFIKTDVFEVCEFDVRDRHDETIRAAFLYRDVLNQSFEETKKDQLSKVLSSPEITPYDIYFMPLSPTYNPLMGEVIERGQRIVVEMIRNHKGKSDETEEIDSPVDALLRVFV